MSKRRNRQPYSEIIDLSSEWKEYRKLCKGTSEKYVYYLDWKKHITEEISKLDDLGKMENFKHYLINNNRVNKSIYIQFVPLMIFCFTIIFGETFQEADSFSMLAGIGITLLFILWKNDYYNKEYCFYCDVLEILEEVYKREDNK